jgi:hypothetical protein
VRSRSPVCCALRECGHRVGELAQAATFLPCVRNVLGSNIRQGTDYPDGDLTRVSSESGKFRNNRVAKNASFWDVAQWADLLESTFSSSGRKESAR